MKINIFSVIISTIIILVFFVTTLNASIIEFKNKYLNLLFDDVNYRFTLQRELVPSKEFSRDLLFFNIPPTSYVTIMIDKISYTLNEDTITKSPSINTDGTLSVECNIQGIEIKLTFRFLVNSYSEENNVVEIEVELRNITNISRSVGVRYLLDTIFGENEPKTKFYLDGKIGIDYELMIDQNNMISYFVSSSDINGVNNLYVYWSRRASKIIFSNWRKLNTVNWDLVPSRFLNYRFSETSGEDCAVAVFFEGINLDPGAKESVSLILSTTEYLPKVTEAKPQEEYVYKVQEAMPVETNVEPTQKVVFVTNVVIITNEVKKPQQEIIVQREVIKTNVLTNFIAITNIVSESGKVTNDERILNRILEIEDKLEKLNLNMEKTFEKITNLMYQNILREDIKKDVEEIKKIKLRMAKIHKTIDTIEERIAMI
ncbi:MAG: hypothetical protein ACK4F9_05920, partial [Brevinematia bacterium]